MMIRSLGPALVLAVGLSTACGDGGTGPVSPSGTDPVRLTSGFADGSPAWTPNGTYLAFLRGAGSAPGVYVMPAAGDTPVRIVGIAGASIGPMSWTR